jgi:hypothetical protein
MARINRSGRGKGRPRVNRIEADLGTPELRLHKLKLTAGADPAQSEHPLAAMHARGLITRLQQESGSFYAYLYRRVVRRPTLSLTLHYQRLLADPFGVPPPGDDLREAHIQALYRAGKNRLLAAGRWVCNATESVAVFQIYPPFLLEGPSMDGRAAARSVQLEAIRAGLDALAACYGRPSLKGAMARHRAPSLVPVGANGTRPGRSKEPDE